MSFAIARAAQDGWLRRPPAPESRTPSRFAGRPAEGLRLQRCACGGSCPACRAKAAAAALPVNDPGDAWEREADAAADAVMSGGLPGRSSASAPALRRCACGGGCPACRAKQEEEALRRDDAGGGGAPGHAPPIVHDVVASSGRPLDGPARGFMEQRFGADFGGVRVHDDARAAESARAVDAHAYTVGDHVVFGAGRYAPGTPGGDRLLAHELAHTLQQGGTARRVSRYRPRKGSVHHGTCDGGGLTEKEFTTGDPWIEQINVHFSSADPVTGVPKGTISATYKGAALPPITGLGILGGDPASGLTDKGSFAVTRIEGCGYHNLNVPTSEGVKGDKRKKYFNAANLGKATMSFAVFFVEGKKTGNQAIHEGSLSIPSLACVHVDDVDKLRQLNYHSRVDKTAVEVTYDPAALQAACCARHAAAGFMPGNPCGKVKASSCP